MNTTTTATKYSEEEIISILKENGKTVVNLSNGETCRLVLNAGKPFRLSKGKSRWGKDFFDFHLIESIVTKDTENPELAEYKIIEKFRKLSLKASFTNDFIRNCKNLPESFEKWVDEGKKSASQYKGITTGTSITGQLVSVKSIEKKLWFPTGHLSEKIKNKESFRSPYFKFNGYDGSVSLEIKDGELYGYLDKEYKGTGNGYYYALINDDYFIGVDKD